MGMEIERRHSGNFEPIDSITPLESITIPNALHIALEYLTGKGCTLTPGNNGITIIFPKGTTEQRLWPVTMMERYRVVLPTQCELRIVRDRKGTVRALFLVDVDKQVVKALMRKWALEHS